MFHRPKEEEQGSEKTAQDNNQAPAATAVKQPDVVGGGGQQPAVAKTTVTEVIQKPVQKTPAARTETKNNDNISKEKTMSNKEESQEKQQNRPIDIPGNQAAQAAYHAGQQPRAPGYNTGSYAAATGGAAVYGSSSDAQVSAGRRLVIGEGITMSGEIEACEFLVVEGTVEAALKGANVLEIAESGVFYGTVEIDEATVAGRFEGDITVNGRLTITAGGSITGTIAYKELAIEAGATLDGKVSPISGAAKSSGKKDEKAATPSKNMKPSNVNESGDEEGELPLSGNVAAAG